MPGQEATITATDGVASMYGSMVQQYKEMTDGELDRHGYKDKLRQLADSCDGSTLLDVGCGHGYMLQWLLEELGVPAGALGGHDLSPEMLKEAAKVLPGVRLTQVRLLQRLGIRFGCPRHIFARMFVRRV